MEKFLKLLKEEYQLDESQASIVISCFEQSEYAKNEYLLQAGEIARNVYLVERGIIRVFSDDGLQEATRRVAFEVEFATSFDSFINQTTSSEYVQALEPSVVYSLSYTNFRKLNKLVPAWSAFYIHRIEQAFSLHYSRIQTFQNMTAKERFELLLSERPQMITRLSNKVLASYLGITQESLSRIKSKP